MKTRKQIAYFTSTNLTSVFDIQEKVNEFLLTIPPEYVHDVKFVENVIDAENYTMFMVIYEKEI